MQEEEYIARQQQIQEGRLLQSKIEVEQNNQSMMMDEQNQGTVKEQLSLDNEIRIIENLLRGKIRVIGDDGTSKWVDPPTQDNVVLSEAGVHAVMNIVQWYLNKNTLLSNYDEETINAKMEDFATALADLFFMKSEKLFLLPTPQEVQDELISKFNKKVQDIVFNNSINGITVDEKEIMAKLIKDINLDVERYKLKQTMKNDKLKLYEMLTREIQDMVHSTYLRALNGQERRTLREHIHVTETHNKDRPQNSSTGIFGFFKK